MERLARFHFVDPVRGHTLSFPQKAVEHAELSAEVIEVMGNLVALRFKGRTRTSEVHDGVHIEGKWNAPGPGILKLQTRDVDAKLEGQAVYDLKAEKFVSFHLIALSSRWGGNAYNGRLNDRDFGPAPMGIVLKLAGKNAAEKVPPLYFRYYGWTSSRIRITTIFSVARQRQSGVLHAFTDPCCDLVSAFGHRLANASFATNFVIAGPCPASAQPDCCARSGHVPGRTTPAGPLRIIRSA